MQLRPEQLAAHLDKPLAPLVPPARRRAAAGDRGRRRDPRQPRAGRASRSARSSSSAPRSSGTSSSSLAGNLSLFGGSKLVDLRIPSGKPGAARAARPCSATCRHRGCNGPGHRHPDHPAGARTGRRRRPPGSPRWSNAGVAIECNAPPLSRLPQWIAERLARQQQTAPRPALEFIAAHVEGNLLAAPPGDPEAGPALSGRRNLAGTDRIRRAERGPLRMFPTCARR
jgi:DNA polymerase-3 subunit delta